LKKTEKLLMTRMVKKKQFMKRFLQMKLLNNKKKL
jgi:hypothetical protein